MVCLMCDRCKKVIEGNGQARMVNCVRPVKRIPNKGCDGDFFDMKDKGPGPVDEIWNFDLCVECAGVVEKFIKTAPDEEGQDEESPPGRVSDHGSP